MPALLPKCHRTSPRNITPEMKNLERVTLITDRIHLLKENKKNLSYKNHKEKLMRTMLKITVSKKQWNGVRTFLLHVCYKFIHQLILITIFNSSLLFSFRRSANFFFKYFSSICFCRIILGVCSSMTLLSSLFLLQNKFPFLFPISHNS